MEYAIRELRDLTGLSQKEFAALYKIPVSTLRKWEQGESSPAPYVVNLLARTLPGTNPSLEKIIDQSGNYYYYDRFKNSVSDVKGNLIFIKEDLDGVKRENLGLYLKDLFDDFYKIQERFCKDCRYDKEEDILWT